ncbi:AsmA family protein [Phreatobacter sp.]|uniref:AsmA family protein n=1 Tax=Phreatobacter sp. TaxID=1966341 RepID=UPI003F71D226
MQNTLLAIAIALIAAIVAAMVGPLLIDWNQHRALVEREASRLFGLPVTIGGDLSIRLLPSISVDARDVSIGTERHGARIGRLSGALRVAPLLRGEAHLTALTIRDADVVIDPSGVPASLLPAEQVAIENGRLTIADSEGRLLVGERIRLTGDSRGARGPVRLEGSAVVAERVMPVSLVASFDDGGRLQMRLRTSDTATGLAIETEGSVAVSVRPRFEGQVVLTGQTGLGPWRVAGHGAITTDALVVDRAEATLGPADRLLRANGSFRLLLGDRPALEAVVTARQFDLDRLVGGQAATPREALTRLFAGLPALTGGALPVSVGFDIAGVTMAGATVLDLRGDMQSDGEGWRAQRLFARLPGDSTAEADGRLGLAPDLRFSGNVSLSAARPGALLAWIDGLPSPEGLDQPLSVTTRLTAEPGRLLMEDVQARTAAGEARGRLALDFPALGRHGVDIDLTAPSLDLDLLMRLTRGTGARLDPATDARIRLRLDEARLSGLLAKGLDLTVSTDGRSFRAERLAVTDLAGVAFDVAGRLDGLEGPLVGRLDGRIQAGTADGLIELLARHDRTRPLAEHLRLRSASLAGLDLGFAFAAGDRASLGLRVDGRLGETVVRIEASGTGDLRGIETLPGRFRAVIEAPRADRVLQLLTGWALAGQTPDAPTRVDLVLDRDVGGGWQVQGDVDAGGTRANLSAGRSANGILRYGLSLQSPDLAPLLPLVGVPAELSGPLPANLNANGDGTGQRWRLGQLTGRIGTSDVEGALEGQGLSVRGRLALGSLTAEALASLVTGPAWLVDVAAGEWPRAAFARTPLDAVDLDLSLGIGRLSAGAFPDLTEIAARLVRRAGRTEFIDLTARAGGGRLTGGLVVDRTALATVVSGRAVVAGIGRAALVPGIGGEGRLELTLSGDGGNPAALMASLRGDGRLAWGAGEAANLNPRALALMTRQAERTQDSGRAMNDAAFLEGLERAMQAPVRIEPGEGPVILAGTHLRAGETAFAATGGRIHASGTLDLVSGTVGATFRIAPDTIPESATMPMMVVRFEGPPGAVVRRLDADDVTGWLGLRLVDRAAEAIRMSESDRLERTRQRAFTRLTARPQPQVEVPLPDMPAELPAELRPPPRVEQRREEAAPVEAPRETAPLPTRRPAEPAQAPRVREAEEAGPPAIVRRAPDAVRPAPATRPPLSILPPLPPPTIVGPPPGQLR